MTTGPILLGAVLLVLISGVVWRLFSRRTSIPCPSWLGWLVEMENPLARDYNAKSIISRLGLEPGMRVLDAGCGPGRVTVPLAQAVGRDGRVTAVDIQPKMLERARLKVEAAGLTTVTFLQAGLGEGKLGEECFDRAVLVTVLGEIPDRSAALADIYRSLKPGGILSVTEIVFDPHYQSRTTVAGLAEGVGFRQHSTYGNRFAFTLNLQK